MKAQSYEELRKHIGHNLVCQDSQVRCVPCNEILITKRDLLRHDGHAIACVCYGLPTKPNVQRAYLIIHKTEDAPANVAIECETCSEVLLDFDKPDRRKD